VKELVITLEQLWAHVGRPRTPGAIHRTMRGDVAVTSWADQLSGEQGWWFALTSGSTLIAIGWTLGDRSDRDAEIARAFARRAPGAVAC